MDECDKSENISSMIDEDGIASEPPGFSLRERNQSDTELTTDKNGNSDLDYDDHEDGNIITTGTRNKKASDVAKNETRPKVLTNVRSLSNLASTYKLELFEKNLLIIYNFNKVNGYKERLGTKNDAEELENTFKIYGFEVERKGNEDLTYKELLNKLDEFDNRDFTDYGCVAIAVMSHGTWDGWIMAKDRFFSENEIIDRLKTRTKPTLVTKPVILIIQSNVLVLNKEKTCFVTLNLNGQKPRQMIILADGTVIQQACRGTNSTKGVNVSTNRKIDRDHKEETHHYYLPVESDMLVIHSSYVGKPSYRPHDGSWFIQIMCKKIRELAASEDFESIMIEVKREIACNKYFTIKKTKVIGDDEYEYHKQVPTVTSSLIRKLYLVNKFKVPVKLSVNENIRKELPPIQNVALAKIGQSDEECGCLLDHFDYLKYQLSLFVSENKYDTQARCLLEQAISASINDMKFVRFVVIAISSYLRDRLRDQPHIKKYLFLYGDCNNPLLATENQDISLDTDEELTQAKSSVAPIIGAQSIFVAINKFKIKYMSPILIGIGTYAAIHVAHNVVKNNSN